MVEAPSSNLGQRRFDPDRWHEIDQELRCAECWATLTAMGNERGSYGANISKSGSTFGAVAIVLGIGAVIYGFSPGARHWYKHGRLPSSEDTSRSSRWHR